MSNDSTLHSGFGQDSVRINPKARVCLLFYMLLFNTRVSMRRNKRAKPSFIFIMPVYVLSFTCVKHSLFFTSMTMKWLNSSAR